MEGNQRTASKGNKALLIYTIGCNMRVRILGMQSPGTLDITNSGHVAGQSLGDSWMLPQLQPAPLHSQGGEDSVRGAIPVHHPHPLHQQKMCQICGLEFQWMDVTKLKPL